MRIKVDAVLRCSLLAVAVEVDDRKRGDALYLVVEPAKASLLIGVRIVNPGDLVGRGKEVAVNEGIVLGEENTEARMRVIPADDPVVGIRLVLDAIDFFPGILRKGNV